MFTWAAISTAFRNNPAARWAAGIGAALAFAITWLALHDRKIRQIERLKAAEQTRKTATKELAKLEERADDRNEKADNAADSVPVGDFTADQLPESIRRGLIRD